MIQKLHAPLIFSYLLPPHFPTHVALRRRYGPLSLRAFFCDNSSLPHPSPPLPPPSISFLQNQKLDTCLGSLHAKMGPRPLSIHMYTFKSFRFNPFSFISVYTIYGYIPWKYYSFFGSKLLVDTVIWLFFYPPPSSCPLHIYVFWLQWWFLSPFLLIL